MYRKLCEVQTLDMWFSRYARGQTHWLQHFAPLAQVKQQPEDADNGLTQEHLSFIRVQRIWRQHITIRVIISISTATVTVHAIITWFFQWSSYSGIFCTLTSTSTMHATKLSQTHTTIRSWQHIKKIIYQTSQKPAVCSPYVQNVLQYLKQIFNLWNLHVKNESVAINRLFINQRRP